jgi:hypothetical protein
MQLELFDSPQLVSSSVIVDRYYFPVIVCGLGSGSLSWTLARSEAEALAFYKHSGVRVFIDRATWGIKTESGYFCCLLD